MSIRRAPLANSVSAPRTAAKRSAAPPLVVALAYDGLCTFEFGCVVELFGLDRPELGVPWYRFAVCASERGTMRAMGGVRFTAPHSLSMLDRADLIVIPGWRDIDDPPPEPLLRKLRAAHARGARLASICSGVFVLAAAGVLDGRRATTHWRYADALAKRFPRITVEPNALYVDEGDVLTSAGSAAGLDMLLHLVRRDHGAAIANRVAQRLVIPPHRDGGQAQFIPRPLPADRNHRLAKLLDWLRAHPTQAHTVASLARRAAMSARTLQRQFREATGLSVYAWLLRERIALAKDALEASSAPLALVAERSGFASDESFRRHFRRSVGTSPGTYRARFARR
jgi:AraC family transcriptional regulator, transcriptional activator FtrA